MILLELPCPEGWSPEVAESKVARTLQRAFAAVGASDALYDLAVARQPPRTEQVPLTYAVCVPGESSLIFGWSEAAGMCTALAAYGVHVVAMDACLDGRLPLSRARSVRDRFAVVRGRLATFEQEGFQLQAVGAHEPDAIRLESLTAAERTLHDEVRRRGCRCPICLTGVFDAEDADGLARTLPSADLATWERATRCFVETEAFLRAVIEHAPPPVKRQPDRPFEVTFLRDGARAAPVAALYVDDHRPEVRSRALSILLKAAADGVPIEPSADDLLARALADVAPVARMALRRARQLPPRITGGSVGRMLDLLHTTRNGDLAREAMDALCRAPIDADGMERFRQGLARWTEKPATRALATWILSERFGA